MERSPQLEELLQEVLVGMQAGDLPVMERLFSRAEGSAMIGTDASEYTRNIDDTLQVMRESMPEVSGAALSIDDARGYVEGSVGWIDSTGRFERDGQSVQVRMTAVAHNEDGQWRLVQAHASIGVPNEHMFDPMFRKNEIIRT
jgi:hypothetical protein